QYFYIFKTDPLHQILNKATERGFLSPIGSSSIQMCTSLYVHDATIFIRSHATDLTNLQHILFFLKRAGELRIRYIKIEETPMV
ncbi:hypothetical protein Zm00014a_044068, partial [Zea mays]